MPGIDTETNPTLPLAATGPPLDITPQAAPLLSVVVHLTLLFSRPRCSSSLLGSNPGPDPHDNHHGSQHT